MKTSRLISVLFLLSTFALGLTGCGHAPLVKKPVLLIQPLLDKIVPADFQGDGDFGTRGEYVTVDVRAGGLRRRQDGRWTWRWLQYRQTIHVALVPGKGYRNEGWVNLGKPDDDAK